jgi:hypothetical protein
MLSGHRESRIAQQDSYWTAFGVAAGEPPRDTPYQHERIKTLLCHRRCMGTLAAAAMPPAENPVAPGARAVSFGSSTTFVGNAARTRRADRQHPIFIDGRTGSQRPLLGLGARAYVARSFQGRFAALFHAGKRPSRAARSGAASRSRKRAPLAIIAGWIFCECGGIGRRARLRIWWGNPCEFESRLSHHRIFPDNP